MDIDAVVLEKVDNDTDFQASIADFTEEDKTAAIEAKKQEVIKNEFATLTELAKKNEQIAKDQKIRAEKAEELAKKGGAALISKSAETGGLSTTDTIYLAKADIHEEDVEEIVNYANKMGVSVKEAHGFFKPILSDRAEKRKTADVTNTNGGRSGVSKVSGQSLLASARNGKLPENDADIQRLLAEKTGLKIK